MGPLGKCYICVANHKMWGIMKANGTLAEDQMTEPVINDAITMVPTWQQQQVMGQLVMACVTVPTCDDHIEVKELSPLDKAMRGGKIIPGALG